MNQPINTAITESPIAAQSAAIVSDEGMLTRRLGPFFWIAVGWIVLSYAGICFWRIVVRLENDQAAGVG